MQGVGICCLGIIISLVIFTILIFVREELINSFFCDLIATICVLIAFFSMIMLFVGPIKMSGRPFVDETAPYSTEHLIALGDNNNIEGRFYCRRGYIEQNLYYQYLVDLGNKGYVANKAPSNDTYIFYSNDNPRMEWYHSTRKWWFFSETKSVRKLYVPQGTIAEDFNIDLK